MSSMAKMFDGSAVARISVEPARFTGTTVCLSATSSGISCDHGRIDLEVVEVDRRHAVLLGDEVGELVLLEEAELRDLCAEAPALEVWASVTRLPQLLLGEKILLDEELADPLVQRPLPLSREFRRRSRRAAGILHGSAKCLGTRTFIGRRGDDLYRPWAEGRARGLERPAR